MKIIFIYNGFNNFNNILIRHLYTKIHYSSPNTRKQPNTTKRPLTHHNYSEEEIQTKEIHNGQDFESGNVAILQQNGRLEVLLQLVRQNLRSKQQPENAVPPRAEDAQNDGKLDALNVQTNQHIQHSV